MKQKVLFICTHNSARSQMAEGMLRDLLEDKYEVFSAGIQPATVHPLAVEAMHEIGIDISNQKSKSIEQYRNNRFDIVVTVCDNVKENCPFFPGKKIIHKSFNDPKEGNITDFRTVRDKIKKWIKESF
jgi:arsenate reductase